MQQWSGYPLLSASEGDSILIAHLRPRMHANNLCGDLECERRRPLIECAPAHFDLIIAEFENHVRNATITIKALVWYGLESALSSLRKAHSRMRDGEGLNRVAFVVSICRGRP